MILVDTNQITIANIMAITKGNNVFSEDLIRHTILNSIRLYNQKFRSRFGRLIVCFDDRDYWRKTIFPYYKQKRKMNRVDSGFDWNRLFEILNKVKYEFDEYVPFKTIHVDHCESDDIIAVLIKNHPNEEHIIVSSDSDFYQLHKHKNVTQYDPIRSHRIHKEQKPDILLKEKLIRGDVGDGIPNILSDDDSIINPDKRQTPIRSKKLLEWLKMDDFCTTNEMKINYDRNKLLIDLSMIPEYIENAIMNKFNENQTKQNFIKYLMNNTLKELYQNLQDFKS